MPDCCHHDHTDNHALDLASISAIDHAGSSGLTNTEEAVFFIQKMDCPTEEKLIRERLSRMEGIAALQFNLIQRELTIQHHLPSVAPVVAALTSLDMLPRVKSDSLDVEAGAGQAYVPSFAIPARRWLLTGIAAIAALASEILAWNSGDDHSTSVIVLSLLAISFAGAGTLKKGWIALRNLSLNMHFLMSLAVIGAAYIGQWPEAAVVIVLFTLAEMIESLSLDRARNAIAGLMAMTPDEATVLQDGAWVTVPAGRIAIDAQVRVRPGERIALDGIVTNGQPSINQAPITGESMPVQKQTGDPVFAGTINGTVAFDFRVNAVQAESTLSRIVRSVQQAQGQRAPTQRFVDRFARYYIPAVVAMAVGVAVLPPLLWDGAFHAWLYKALVLLVIACPCALVISTPVTIVSGLAAAARHGILIKGGVHLEQGRLLKALALDKTGTITHGMPVVSDIVMLSSTHESVLMQQAASLAQRSDHPISLAIAAYARTTWPCAPSPVSSFEALTGRGVQGNIGSDAFLLGNHRMVHEAAMCSPALEARLHVLEQEGKTTSILCRNGKPELLIAVADTVRASSRDAIADLQRMGVRLTLLSGDNAHTARAIADVVQITDARADLLPEDKLNAVNGLITRYGHVGMVGDGINDAPALAQAHIGFAMGAAGTDTALETADVALMDDDLRKIPDFIRLSRRTHRILIQNFVIALGIKATFLLLALSGESTLWMAVFADLGASLIVVGNGLRLTRSL